MNLLTGAHGLLGRHLKLDAYKPTHEEFDILLDLPPDKKFDLIVHAAAYTSVEQAEIDKRHCFDINVRGTLNLLTAYPDTPFIYISTEYSHNPVNFYSITKSLAEQLVTYHTAPYLIIRTLFKERPWKYEYAFMDKMTLGDYVDVIADKIDNEIKNWDRHSKLVYVGTGRKSYYDLALETKPDVKPNRVEDIKGVKIPRDYK